MKPFKTIGLLVALVLVLVFPLLFSDPTMTGVAIFTLIFAGAAVAWNIFSGYTGYFSLGHATFYGIGAYTLALFCKDWNIPGGYIPFLLIPLAGLVASVFAIPLGLIALRTRRHIFIVFTIAIFFIFQLLAFNLPGITNGAQGIYLPLASWGPIFFNIPFYYVALTILLACLGISWWIRNSKYGLGLLAIRDDEDRALSLGVKTFRYKLAAYIISAFFIGMAGALLNYFIGSTSPAVAFDPSFDVTIALMVLLGGIGTLIGPLLGALLLEPLQQYLTVDIGTVGLDLIIFGAVLLAVILWLPQGIIPTLRSLWTKRTATTNATSSAINRTGPKDAVPSVSQQRGKG
jgi:ABC-type branched-subunit amino acid transport system permease subunit